MRRVVSVMTALLQASVAIWGTLVTLSWIIPALLEERFFLNLSGASLGLAMVSSGFLFRQEFRASRQVFRVVRRKNRDFPAEKGG